MLAEPALVSRPLRWPRAWLGAVESHGIMAGLSAPFLRGRNTQGEATSERKRILFSLLLVRLSSVRLFISDFISGSLGCHGDDAEPLLL